MQYGDVIVPAILCLLLLQCLPACCTPASLKHACSLLYAVPQSHIARCAVDSTVELDPSMDQQDDGSDVESEAYLGDDDGNVGPQDQEVADLDGAEAGVVSGSFNR